jgi:hypothetical protein
VGSPASGARTAPTIGPTAVDDDAPREHVTPLSLHEELAQLCYEADLLVVGSRGAGHALPAGPARSGPDPERPGYLRHDAAGGSGEGEASAPPFWLPPGKIARRWLATWLAAVDDRAAPARLPRAGGVPVQIDLYRDVIRP